MKRTRLFLSFCIIILSLVTFSCQTMKNVFGEPSIHLNAVAIKSIDFEGITFVCDYTIDNPYPVGISLQEVAADIIFNEKIFTKLKTDSGLTIASKGKFSNKLDFKIPYTAILDFASGMKGKESLPFAVKGNVDLDVSAFSSLGMSKISLPFSKDFDVPVFKPELSVSNPKVQLPTLTDLIKAFTNGGIGITKATQLANSLISGQKVSANIFDGIDINIDFVFDLNVKNAGNAAWNFKLNDCSLNTASGKLATASPSGTNSISSSSGTIPLKVSFNTLKAGTFIVQLINKSGKNPVLQIESDLSFPKLSYAPNIPLGYSYEIPLSKVKVEN